MTRTRRIGLFWLLFSSIFFIAWGTALERTSPGGMIDFKAVYYGARCLMQHSDPYIEGEFLRVYRAEGGQFPSDPAISHLFSRAVLVCINMPTSLFLMVPFAILPWGLAHVLWMTLVAGSLFLAGFLVWNIAENYAHGISLLLICILLANSEILFASGNLAGIAVSLCVIAVWCFLRGRFVPAGIVCLAVSLAIKPHDAGLVWLYFLLIGGVYRKRALQTLVLTIALCLPAVLWVTHVAPQWMPELRSNLTVASAHGDLNDPGLASISRPGPGTIIDLQSAISVFWDNPRVYNPVSYLVCGALLLVWLVRTLRSQFTQRSAWLALAAITALSMLPVYHRLYDAKLLLLTVPACAMLWAEGGPVGWIALLVNTAGVVLTGDIPTAILTVYWNGLHVSPTGIGGKMLSIVLVRPAPLILLAMGIFYLWAYVRRAVPDAESGKAQNVWSGAS